MATIGCALFSPEPAVCSRRAVASRSRNAVLVVARRAQSAITTRANERDDFSHVRIIREFCRHLLKPLFQRTLGCKQEEVGSAQIIDRLVGETAALEADEIEAGKARAVAPPGRWNNSSAR